MNIIMPINVKMPTFVKCWHFNIYEQDKTTSESSKARNIIIFQHFSFDEQMKFHAKLNRNKVFKSDQDHTVNP